MTDVGGSVPGSLPCAASSIFEEGIQIPVTKVASKGVWNNDLMEVIYRNVRLPEWNRGDVRALVAACEMGKYSPNPHKWQGKSNMRSSWPSYDRPLPALR